jgi:hypothetical protein
MATFATEMRRQTSWQQCHPKVTFARLAERQCAPYFGLAGVKQNRYNPRNWLRGAQIFIRSKGSFP